MFGTKPCVEVEVQREAAGGEPPPEPRRGPYTVLTDEAATAQAVRELIKASGLPALRVAARLGVDPASLQKYLNVPGVQKQWRTATVKQLARIAAVCGGRLILEFPREPLT